MPRTYKPVATKKYKKYDEVIMHNALSEYKNTNSSLAIISQKYNIPKSVLHRHSTRFMKKQGGQMVLSVEAEDYIVENINHCSEWGYPLDTYDLRILVKGYLDRAGITVNRFKENLPGPDFVKSFLKRNKGKISLRISQNIKRSRASVSPEIIEAYFEELSKSLEGVPEANIVNYDETNLSDDPGRRKVITKRGAKYPERVMNHSKASTSLMIAASAEGKLLPCYVVYKSKHLYETWVKQGPKDCRYNCTTSGWFDSNTFEDWVRTVAMPYFQGKTGKKILIGDNLSSHLSLDLIRECKEHDIHFIFLPANSTHLTQPLDVAFFRPTKGAWRDILFKWKKTEGRTLASIPKSVFPGLLNNLLVHIECQTAKNVLAGFMKAGISPINKNKVLERLPGKTAHEVENLNKEAIDQTVLCILKEMRYGTGSKINSNKRKKINVKPGQSVSVEFENEMSEKESNEEPSSYFRNKSDESDLEENEEPLERSIIGTNTDESVKFQEKSLTKPTSLPKNVKPRRLIAKQIPETKKRKFEAKYEMKMKTESAISSTVTLKTFDKPVITLSNEYSELTGIENKRRTSMSKAKSPVNLQITSEKSSVSTKLENKNQDVFKKPSLMKEYKKHTTKKSQKDIRLETGGVEEELMFDNINISEYQWPEIAEFNVDMPILFEDNFVVSSEIEIDQEDKENTENENDCTQEKVEVVHRSSEEKKIKVTSVENLDKKVMIDLKQNEKIALNSRLQPKGQNRKYYRKDEDIMRDLMDDDVE